MWLSAPRHPYKNRSFHLGRCPSDVAAAPEPNAASGSARRLSPRRPRIRHHRYTSPTASAASNDTPMNVWVNPRWWANPSTLPQKDATISISGISAEMTRVAVASAVLRFKPARLMQAPVSRWVMGSKKNFSGPGFRLRCAVLAECEKYNPCYGHHG